MLSSVALIVRTLAKTAFQVISTTIAHDETFVEASSPYFVIFALFLVNHSVSSFLGESVSLALPTRLIYTVSSNFQVEVVVESIEINELAKEPIAPG